jgi:hypothetical protein
LARFVEQQQLDIMSAKMMCPKQHKNKTARGLAILAVVMAASLQGGRAEAQIGFFGPGFFTNPLDSSATVNAINQRSQLNAQAAIAQRQNIQPRVPVRRRDVEFVDRIGIDSRSSMESRAARRYSPTRVATATPAPVQPRPTPPAPPAAPIIPLSGFFNASRVLVWPADAPTDEGLGEKRDTSDKACLVVYDEVTASKIASISSVTKARDLLLDYGRPALDRLRHVATTQVADTFHLFLLSLYESLAQAANPPTKA